MKINLNLLPKSIDGEYEIPKSFYENTDILSISKVEVKGKIFENLSSEVEINATVKGSMKLLDAVTNEEIDYPFMIEIIENLFEFPEEMTNYLEKKQNILDIIEFLWENIVLEVPIRITNSTNRHMKGDGWELNANNEDREIDPRFEKLSEVFKGGD